MRTRNALALAALTTAATAVVLPLAQAALAQEAPAPAPAPAAPARPAAHGCGAANARDFPLAALIRGGPSSYPAGGGFRSWDLELTNTTAEPCRDIHPVLVLTDRARTLRPAQIRAEFYDAQARLWRPVTFEGTDQDESVGVFDEAPARPGGAPAFRGFAVPAGGTLTVPVRLSFSADAASDEVVVSASVVHKRGGDGDWVGESDDYRLTIGPAGPDAGTFTGDEQAPAEPPPAAEPPAPDGPATRARAPLPARPADRLPLRPELAHTGRDLALRLAPVSVALLATGTALLLLARRRARRPARSTRRRYT